MAMNIVVVAAVWQSNAANAESTAPDFALFILRGGQLAAPGRAQTRLGLPPARNEGRGPSTDDKVWDSKLRITRPTFEVDDLSFTIPPRGRRQSLD